MKSTFFIDLGFSKKTWDDIRGIVSEISHPKKHISVVLEKNQVVSIGANTHHTKPITTKYGYQFGEYHSELDAIIKMSKRSSYRELTLINFRFNRMGEIRMARPCIKCMRWCKSYFDRIVYSHENCSMMYELDLHSYDIYDHARNFIPEFELMSVDNGFRNEIVSIFKSKDILKNERPIKIKKIKVDLLPV
jgi:hypothetical protein